MTSHCLVLLLISIEKGGTILAREAWHFEGPLNHSWRSERRCGGIPIEAWQSYPRLALALEVTESDNVGMLFAGGCCLEHLRSALQSISRRYPLLPLSFCIFGGW